MKKLVASILSIAMAVSLAACGGSSQSAASSGAASSGAASSGAASSAAASSAAASDGAADLSNVEPVTLKLAHIYAAEHPFTIGLDEFVAAVSEASQGKLTIEHHPAAELGDEPSIHEGLQNGTVDMAVMGISEAGKDYEPVMVMDAPFIFESAEQMLAANESDTAKELWSSFSEASGITMLSPIYYGTRQLTTNVKVSSVDDLAGLKIRVPSQENSVAVWTALGATPTPMNLSEVYLSLQTGVVDGQENPLATIVSQGFPEVCDYLNVTNHSVQSCPLFISTSVYESLDPALAAILDDCIAEYIPAISQNIIDYEVTTLDELDAGDQMEVNRDVDIDSFRNALADYIASGEETWGEGVYAALSSTGK